MSDILEKILDVKRQEIQAAQELVSFDAICDAARNTDACRDFYTALTKQNPRGINVISEIKRASPSAGLIREDFDPAALAGIYKDCGADAISILTDEQFFQGHLSFINEVKQAVDLPVIRKDFIIDPYQVHQARAAGADAILLIAEALAADQLEGLFNLADSLGLTVLVEVHEMDSLLMVKQTLGTPEESHYLLGINNRNLKTMEVTLESSLTMKPHMGADRGLISESGIKTRHDVQQLIAAGFSGILIGETLMRSKNIADKFKELFG